MWSIDSEKDIVVSVARGDIVLNDFAITRVDILKIDVEGYEKNVLSGMRETLEKDRPIILFELVGTELKGGFRSEEELRELLYPDSELFTLGGRAGALLLPFDWHGEEAVCLPKELVDDFAGLRARLPNEWRVG